MKYRRNYLPLIIAISLFTTVALIIVSILIYGQLPNRYGNETAITNLSDLVDGLSKDQRDEITSSLYNILLDNSVDEQTAVSTSANIRPESIVNKYDTVENYHYGNFIVDLPTLKQSYLIQFDYSTDSADSSRSGYPLVVSCLRDPALTIYPDSHLCVDDVSDEYSIIDYYLPHSLKLPSGEDVIVRSFDTNGNLQVYLYSCDKKNPDVSQTKKVVKAWTSTITQAEYEMDVRTGYCKGDAI